ncbi:hypothetical protein CW749_11125 [Vibrio sp. vnigr-6D03]|uniref:hypothetical protein n=1 Tax=Vibrio sp. vnigr-6D03 TaxID=2058088 RepID=UPI000C349754|nr:hypothetical protein [Vibrio sp. vnigr-6D03]PKF79534.1 hypothetical protein CW749_11125 [Vibrio sp. vnigr-6D03]
MSASKPNITDLTTAYDSILAAHAPVHHSNHAHDAYEVYLFSLVIKAAQAEGATVSFEDNRNQKNPSTLIFRSSPATIYSSANAFTHALISFASAPILEVHVGVYVQGLAGVIHECDVAVIDQNEARFCRAHGVHPKKNKVVIAVECKLYENNLGIKIGREFIGMTADLGKENRFLFSNSSGASLEKILVHHKRHRLMGVTPLDHDREEQAIAKLRDAFRDYIAKNR